MRYTVTSLTVDPELLEKAKKLRLNMSEIFRTALMKAVNEQPTDPFSDPRILPLLPSVFKAIKDNPKFAVGQAKRLVKLTGVWVEPDLLLKKAYEV